MQELKVNFRYSILWVLYYNVIETGYKIRNVYSQGVIANRPVWKWFSNFCSGHASLRDEQRPGRSSDFDQDTLISEM